MKFKQFFFFGLLVFLFMSCNFTDDFGNDRIVNGLKPIYGDPSTLSVISIIDTIEMENPGKIVFKSPYLFVNEIDKGIHVINNSNPENPIREAFISIPFNKDLAVKGDYIYADNNKDLISLKYISKDSIQLTGRNINVFDQLSAFPTDFFGYFECIDESKGTVVGWEEAELINPKCKK